MEVQVQATVEMGGVEERKISGGRTLRAYLKTKRLETSSLKICASIMGWSR